jgi:RimJ/RimL family protein N-acetyltransferase
MAEGRNTAHEVRLRQVEDRDLVVFFDNQADPVAAAMSASPTRNKGQFAAHWAKMRRDDTKILRAIEADGAVAGTIGSWDEDGQRLLGYWIGREQWGRGIATRALTQFLTEDSARPLYAHVAVHNAGSIRVLTKAGFRRDRELEAQAPPPEDGVDEFIFVLDA